MTEAQKKSKKKPKKTKKTLKEIEKPVTKPEKFFEAVGRRKTAVAMVRLFTTGEKSISINKKPLENYFSLPALQKIVLAPLEIMKCLNKFRISVIVRGGGMVSQAEAIRHGLARVLTLLNPNFRKRLKKAGFLKRDSRMKERKKFGLKRARRAPQWQKR